MCRIILSIWKSTFLREANRSTQAFPEFLPCFLNQRRVQVPLALRMAAKRPECKQLWLNAGSWTTMTEGSWLDSRRWAEQTPPWQFYISRVCFVVCSSHYMHACQKRSRVSQHFSKADSSKQFMCRDGGFCHFPPTTCERHALPTHPNREESTLIYVTSDRYVYTFLIVSGGEEIKWWVCIAFSSKKEVFERGERWEGERKKYFSNNCVSLPQMQKKKKNKNG